MANNSLISVVVFCDYLYLSSFQWCLDLDSLAFAAVDLAAFNMFF